MAGVQCFESTLRATGGTSETLKLIQRQHCDQQHMWVLNPPPPWKEYCGCRMAAGWVLGSNDRPSGDRGATHRLIGKGGMIVRPSFCSSKTGCW